MNSFSAHLQKIFSKHNPTDIDELVLDDNMETDGTLSEEQKTALEEYVNLVHLSLGNIGLKSIKNLPRIKGLKNFICFPSFLFLLLFKAESLFLLVFSPEFEPLE